MTTRICSLFVFEILNETVICHHVQLPIPQSGNDRSRKYTLHIVFHALFCIDPCRIQVTLGDISPVGISKYLESIHAFQLILMFRLRLEGHSSSHCRMSHSSEAAISDRPRQWSMGRSSPSLVLLLPLMPLGSAKVQTISTTIRAGSTCG